MSNTYHVDGVECPFCGHIHENAREWLEDANTAGEENCDKCGLLFLWTADFTVNFNACAPRTNTETI